MIGAMIAAGLAAAQGGAVPAPPPPPPPLTEADHQRIARQHAAWALVMNDYQVLGSHEPAAVAALYEEAGHVPAVVEGRPMTLRDFYEKEFLAARFVSVKGCFGHADLVVTCRLYINRASDAAPPAPTHLANYYVADGRVRRVVVSAAPPPNPTVPPHG